jgi:iron complex transport system ATP-binding protein
MLLEVDKLSFSYGKTQILKDISLGLKPGQVVSIVGPNGTGKTTLLKCMNAIYKTKQKAVFINGVDIQSIHHNHLAKLQGYVPQQGALHFPLTVMETVMLGRKPYISWGVKADDLQVVGDIMAYLGLEHFADRYLDELSGGERQKVLIARALAQEAQILMLDEPTSALDIKHQLEVLELLKSLAHEKHHLVVLILHDLELASRYSDHIILLNNGAIYAQGIPQYVLTAPHIEVVYGVKVNIEQGIYGLKITPIEAVHA